MKRSIAAAVCALALCGIAASVASATEPAFYECVKVTGGKYKSGCTEEGGKGGFELVEGTGKPKPLKGTLDEMEPFIPEISAPGDLSCKKLQFSGVLGSPTTMRKVTITRSKCEETVRERTCTSAGQKPGTIVTGALEGTLGYVDAAEHRVGIDFKAEGPGPITAYSCEGLEWETGGSWIGEMHTPGHLQSAFSISFQPDGEGFQAIKSFEGGPEDVPLYHLDGSGPFKGSIAGTVSYKGPKLLLKG